MLHTLETFTFKLQLCVLVGNRFRWFFVCAKPVLLRGMISNETLLLLFWWETFHFHFNGLTNASGNNVYKLFFNIMSGPLPHTRMHIPFASNKRTNIYCNSTCMCRIDGTNNCANTHAKDFLDTSEENVVFDCGQFCSVRPRSQTNIMGVAVV